MRYNANSKEFFSVVATLHHQAIPHGLALITHFRRFIFSIVPVHQALDDRHLSLLELLLGITASGVGEVNGMADLDVICEGDILHLNTVIKTR